MRQVLAILAAAFSAVALVMTFVPHFIRASVDAGSFSASESRDAWFEMGAVGGLLLVLMVALAIVVVVMEFVEPRVGRWFALGAALVGALAAICLVLFELTGGPDTGTIPDSFEFHVGPGWSGWACFVLLGCAIVVNIALTTLVVPAAKQPGAGTWVPRQPSPPSAWPPPPPPPPGAGTPTR